MTMILYSYGANHPVANYQTKEKGDLQMTTILWELLGNLVIKADHALESGMLEMGMSARSVDFLMLGLSGIMLLAILAVIVGLILMYGSVLIASYNRMIKLKSKRLRRNWSVIFLIDLVMIIIEIVTLFN